MDLKEYDKLRSKRDKKDYEGRNKGLNKWLFKASFAGNIVSIFFAYFLIFPAFYKTISIHLFDGLLCLIISIVITIFISSVFELIKRYLVKNFSLEYLNNNKKFSPTITGLFATTLIVIGLSFFIAMNGSKNLATTSRNENIIVENITNVQIDSITKKYENKLKSYNEDNNRLRTINNDLRQKLLETPASYRAVRTEYQNNIDKNLKVITDNENAINLINSELKQEINKLNSLSANQKENNKNDNIGLIILFLIIAAGDEILIIWGIYFRENYEHKLYEINHQKFEKIYQRKDRYRALLAFVYNDGKLNPGDRVISGLELKAAIAEKTNINNSNKLVDEFLKDMDRLGIFSTNGKRRHIAILYSEAQNILENFDDAFRILENMK